MQFIDTHSHLYFSVFNDDRKEVIVNSIKNNVTKILLPNINSDSINDLLKLCYDFPQNCFPMLGLHPTSVKENYKDELLKLETYINKTKYYAIGETGIDLYWDKTYFKEQVDAFKYQIGLSKSLNLPVVVHTRESFKEVFNVFDEFNDNKLKGVFHCFSGTLKEAQKVISYGFKLGIGGVVTFKNSNLSKIIKEIDLEHILLETDAPFLTPMPHRGERNESAYIIHIAKKIAEIKNENIENIAKITSNNAKEIFNI